MPVVLTAKCGSTETAIVLDKIKSLGYKYSTIGALTVSVSDMVIPEKKKDFLAEAEAKVDVITKKFKRGLMTDEERHNKVIDAWNVANDKITDALLKGLGKYNNIFMMANSGARGSNSQIKQLAGMRGLMANPSGGIIELPIKSNFREGLSVLEYFISAHGARKGLTDTALRTADSGYLTRRLVDVSQEIIINEWDCTPEGKEAPGLWVKAFVDGNEVIESLQDRIRGRWSPLEIRHPETGEVIVPADTQITPDMAEKVEKAGVKEVFIRTVLTCRSEVGICAKCYGANMASGRSVRIGESVGIIAAQSIGEPGTQLTMRTFHTGGIAGDDITQGLPRVEELFEARKPKGLAIIAEFGGRVAVTDTKKKREVTITNNETGEAKDYLIPYGSRIKVYDGDIVAAGDEITEGSVNPHDILKIKGLRGVQDYLIQEVQRVYRLQGVEINDKHVEVIVRQMLKRVKIEENGDTSFLPGSLVDWLDFENTNERMLEEGKEWDCTPEGKEAPGLWVSAFLDGNEVIESLQDRIRGRWSVYEITDPATGEVIVPADSKITPDMAEKVEKAGIKKVFIRTVLTCRSEVGICAKCYGANMASGRSVRIGESVGIIAAQSIGEPGTQLTMRTFHTGGIAGDDITQGLPRVEELFEARKPKGLAIIAEFGGRVTVTDTKKKREVTITNNETGESKDYLIPYGSRIKVYDGDVVEAGDEITEGSVNPHDILKIKGLRGVQDYLIQEVQRVYRLQGVEINDKHVEVIVRQMLKRVKIEENGDTDFLPGSLVDWLDFENTNERMVAEGKEPAKGSRVLLGITKASLATESFLSAASFQETTRVLTEAAIKGKVDPLIGLKENVILGKLIPAGTGMMRYRNISIEIFLLKLKAKKKARH